MPLCTAVHAASTSTSWLRVQGMNCSPSITLDGDGLDIASVVAVARFVHCICIYISLLFVN